MRRLVAAALVVLAVASAVVLARRARSWNEDLGLVPAPLAAEPPRIDDPHTPRLSRRVMLVVIDGLRADESSLPFLDELRARGTGMAAQTSYPSISRPNYVTILTGVPPRDSGVRTNAVRAPTGVDAIMDRVHAAGLRAVTASDFGSFTSLFAHPGLGSATPFDDVRRTESLDELAAAIADLAHAEPALLAILALDVDRAGHAYGVGDEYRAAAAAVDQMLRSVVDGPAASLDLARDTIIVTADHGHVAPGGHGGLEPEVLQVPLVLAGAGIVPGASVGDARLLDVAPTIAALLGIPAPGHAEGRALVELLRLSPEQAARRAAVDTARARAVLALTEAAAAADDDARPEPLRIAGAATLWLGGLAIAIVLRRRAVVALTWSSALGATAFVAMLVAEAIILRGQPSPSFVPSLPRTELAGTLGAVSAVVLHLIASVGVLRRAPDRVAAVTELAAVGLTVSLGTVAIARAWFTPPFVDVPSPFWLVASPALDLAAATTGAAVALSFAIAAAMSARARRRR
jgi:hypothetical protein